MKCFYHKSDLDGHCSGAIVKLKYPDCEMIGVDYGDCLNEVCPEIQINEEVFVVDFCFDDTDMDHLNRKLFTLHWIDHHASSIENAHKRGFLASGSQSLKIGKAACELTWEYLYPKTSIPHTIYLLGRYDVWDHEAHPDVLAFQWGMRNFPDTLPENINFWDDIFHKLSIEEDVIETGYTLLKFQQVQDAKYAKGMAYEAQFDGLRAIVMNKAYANSSAFDAVYDPEKHDIMILYGVKPGELKYSIYCNKAEIDVSKIARKYGGGGHKGAAGFYSEIPIV